MISRYPTCRESIDFPTYLLAEVADRFVILIEDNTDLVHQSDLLCIVAIEGSRARVDVGEESQDVLSRDGLSTSDGSSGSSGRHFREEVGGVVS